MRITRTDVKTSFYLPEALLHAAKVQAASEGLPLRAFLIAALEAHLAAAPSPSAGRPRRGEGRAA
jgi:hypothetical protein